MSIRLTIDEIELIPDGILIKQMSLIDAESGEVIRIATLNQELADFIGMAEFKTKDFEKLCRLKEKNPEFKNLINTLKLYI